jgi:hypothetical protein
MGSREAILIMYDKEMGLKMNYLSNTPSILIIVPNREPLIIHPL